MSALPVCSAQLTAHLMECPAGGPVIRHRWTVGADAGHQLPFTAVAFTCSAGVRGT